MAGSSWHMSPSEHLHLFSLQPLLSAPSKQKYEKREETPFLRVVPSSKAVIAEGTGYSGNAK